MHRRRRRWPRARRLSQLLVLVLVGAALVEELGKDPGEREWHGTVVGFVPYDFRRPTFARAKSAVWAPDDPQILKPHSFGVGWTVNVGRVVRLLRP